MVTIRKANTPDAISIAVLGQRHVNEKTPGRVYDIDTCERKLVPYCSACTDWDKVAFVAVEGRSVVGYVIAEINGNFYNDERIARMLLLFVTREYRQSWIAVKLFRAYVDWSKEMQCAEVWAGVEYEEGAERVFNLYKSFGFTKSGHLCKLKL